MVLISPAIIAYLIYFCNPVLSRFVLADSAIYRDDIAFEDTFEYDNDGFEVEKATQVPSGGTRNTDIKFQPVFPKRSLIQSLEAADQLSEWTPISNVISVNETQYYEFLVNTTQLGLGEYYEILIFLSGNICALPEGLDDAHSVDNDLKVYYSYNQSDLYDLSNLTSFATFEYGYMQDLASNPTADPYSNLYLAVVSPDAGDAITGNWSYELGISQNDLVFQWDDRSWATLVDSDDDSALFVTGNLSSAYTSGQANSSSQDQDVYKLHIYDYSYKDYFVGLNRSWCAIKNGPALISSDQIRTELTTRYGSLKQQFYVDGLNSSTTYIAYLTQDFSGNSYGGSIFQQFEFETLDENTCELIYDLSFCEDVAYSVPVSSAFLDENETSAYKNKSLLSSLYDNHTENLYENFGKAIQVIACDDELDSRYSPIRTCDDCITSYKEWLCAVTIPRCTTRNVTGYKYREPDSNRNSFVDDDIVPPAAYFEMLPCVNMCHAIVRDCPSDFGFACPTDNRSIALSYYWDDSDDDEYSTCNYFGTTSSSSRNSDVSSVSTSLAHIMKQDTRLAITMVLLTFLINV